MKAAWIGVFGAIIGALIGVFGTPAWNKVINEPIEGVFSADFNCLTGGNIAPELRKQINSYPCNLKIAHISGPSIQDLSFKLKSKYKISRIQVLRNDEKLKPIVSRDGKTLSIETPKLRKKAVINLNFTSGGEPSFEKEIIMSEGGLVDEESEQDHFGEKKWYQTDYFIVPLLMVILLTSIAALYIIIRKYIEPKLEKTNAEKIKIFAAIAATSIFIPIPYTGAITKLFIIYAVALILLKLNEDNTK